MADDGEKEQRSSARTTKCQPPIRFGNVTNRRHGEGSRPRNLATGISSDINEDETTDERDVSTDARSESQRSSVSHQSSSATVKKSRVDVQVQIEIDKLEKELTDIERDQKYLLFEVQRVTNKLEKANTDLQGEGNDHQDLQKQIQNLEEEKRIKIQSYELKKIDADWNTKEIQRKINRLRLQAKLDKDEIDLEEESSESKSEDVEADSKHLTKLWVDESDPSKVTVEDLENKNKMLNAKIAEEVEAALISEQQEALEKATVAAQSELERFEAEEIQQQSLRQARRLQLMKEVEIKKAQLQANTQRSTSLNRRIPLTSLTPPSNQTEEMMCRYFEMQMLIADQGRLGTRSTNSNFLARQSHAKDLPIFEGKPEEWPTFIAEFERSSTDCGFSKSENMSRLRKCLKGEAIRTVQCLMVSPENLTKVLSTLKERFGQPEHIIEAMILKARNIPVIKEEQLETLIEFGNAIQNVTMTIKALKCDDYLSNPQLIRELEAKLPVQFRMNWMRWITSNALRSKNLHFFSEWIEAETILACRLCPPKTESDSKKKLNDQNKKRRANDTVWATSYNDDKKPGYRTKYNWQSKERKCVFCSNIGHRVAQCKSFEEQDLNNRWKVVRENKLCFSCLIFGHDTKACRSKKACGQDNCDKMHHRLLHNTIVTQELPQSPPSEGVLGHAREGEEFRSRVNLQILPVLLKGPKGTIRTYAMLDGGANITLIEENMANQLGLKGPNKPLTFSGLHPTAAESSSLCVDLIISPVSRNKEFQMKNVRTVKHMPLPYQSIHRKHISKWKHLQGLDIHTYEGVQPKILIGLDHISIMVIREIREGPANAPVAVRTNLGWTLITRGNIPDSTNHSFFCHEKDELHQIVRDYFTTESFGVKICKELPRSTEDKRAQTLMDTTIKRVGVDGLRWETGLLWKVDDVKLPESKSTALSRLRSIERRLDKDQKFACQYYEKMQHYFDKGYARKLTSDEAKIESARTWYLPHFGTSKPSKPDKIRLVFDAAAKSHGVCLNDVLLKGHDQVNPLPSVLYKFRQKAIGITGDIREMFHQVNIRDEDQDSFRFLWRGSDRLKDPEVYQMQVMVFGAACSPACAQEVKNKNASEHFEKYKEAANAIIFKHFVDDYLDSFDNPEDASRVISEVIQIHRMGGFEIVNFISSSKKVLSELTEDQKAVESKSIDPDANKMERVLGLHWDPSKDEFTFTTNFSRVEKDVISGERMPTKREALSLIMSIYDPLGFLAHFTIKARIQLQETWKSEIGWNDELPSSIHGTWIRWIEELQLIPTFRLRRCYHPEFSKSKSVQLHIFCDASQQAFAAVAYYRIETRNEIKTAFVAAKARVAPLKTLCMPRLELQAAVLGARLAVSIKEQHEIKPITTHYWTDSAVAYYWVRSDGSKHPQFVSHRIGEIQETTLPEDWHWLPTKENVADEATRDTKATNWSPQSRWLVGPEFLRMDENNWPKKSTELIINEVDKGQIELKKEFIGVLKITDPIINWSDYSSWNKLRKFVAWIQRFVGNCKKKEGERNLSKCITISDLRLAENWLWKQSQNECFHGEIQCILKNKKITNESRLLSLDPYLDEDGVLRVRGRMDKAYQVSKALRNPVIMDSKHPTTRLIIRYYHEEAGHQGQERVVNELRQLYYIPSIRSAVRSAWHHCQRCRNERAVPSNPQMGLIPECRLQSFVRPFTVSGLDYFGPIGITVGRKHEKRFGALFTCMTTRAVHVEIAASLTTDSCIMAIRRFASRRGNPAKLYSDNGTNFRGADRELKVALQELDQEKIQNKLTNLGIDWHFIPPAAPHMGGSWERLVKSIKVALKSTLKGRYPKEELLQTLLAEAEHVVNSRPLTHVSFDPKDEEALTPNHFLIGCSSNMQPHGVFDERDVISRNQWRSAEALTNMFWRRWVKEYLPTLTRRTKWYRQTKSIQVGDVALIADNNLTRNYWPKGIVVATYPGRDGQIRVVDLRAANGTIYKRPVTKICVLDVQESSENAAASPLGGSMSSSTQEKSENV